jgi:hypothetical protein
MPLMPTQNTVTDLFNLDDDIRTLSDTMSELRAAHANVETMTASEANDACKLFCDVARNYIVGTDEIVTLVGPSCTISFDHYDWMVSTLEDKEITGLAIMGSSYGDLEGYAGSEDKTVSEFLMDNCDTLADEYRSAFPKHEARRQKEIARKAHREKELQRLESGEAYDHETAPNKYAHVREKDVKRVGKALKYPSVPHQSQYGFKSLGVIRFAREVLYSTAEMDVYEQAIYDHMIHYSDECGYVSIGYDQIATERNISKSSAIRARKKLAEKGLIEEVYTGNGISKKTNRYRITLSCTAGENSEEFLAKRWYVLTGKTDFNKRWDKLREIKDARKG